LFDLPAVHHRDTIRDDHRLPLIVGNVDHRDPGLLMDAADLEPHLFSQVRIEVGEGFIEEQGVRLDHERAGQGHSLLLAARELMRVAPLISRESYQLHDRVHAPLDLPGLQSTHLQAKGYILKDGHMRPERVALEHERHAPALGRNSPLGVREEMVIAPDLAAIGEQKPSQNLQRRGFAAARRPEKGEQLAVFDGDPNAAKRQGRTE
jgi:hypothetical protein